VTEFARELVERRGLLCEEHQIGLGRLYNRLDDCAFEALRNLHIQLERAVLAAYGWPTSILADRRERNRRLYALNAAIRSGVLGDYTPF